MIHGFQDLVEADVEQGLPSWVELRRTPDRRSARELSLVLQSMGIEHGLFEQRGESLVVVRPADAERAGAELDRYERENRGWPPPRESIGNLSEGLIGAFGWASVLTVVEVLVRTQARGLDWWQQGRGLAVAEREGELWRAWTGLTLHVDLAHFLSNLVFGALFTLLACELIGAGVGLTAILAAGALGNFANAWLQSPEHVSVGASTAVFAALGLLVSYQWRRREQLRQSHFRRFAPLIVGAFLLAAFGLSPDTKGDSGRNVDYVAHASGFVAGALAGMLLSLASVRRLSSPRLQTTALLLAPALTAIAWWMAF